MTQKFRVPGPLGMPPNGSGGTMQSPLRINAGDVIDVFRWTNPITFSGKLWQTITGVEVNPWFLAEQAVRVSSTRIAIPPGHVRDLKRYADANPDDGRILNYALEKDPSCYKGGWLLGINGEAEAITFGNSIFFAESPPAVSTYVHEMVHIYQYHKLGRDAFIASYFGLSLATIQWRLMTGADVNIMRSSPHEEQGYQLERRFRAWKANNP